MQRPAFSQSPKRVGSGPSRPPISFGGVSCGVSGGEPALSAGVILWSAVPPPPGSKFVSAIEPDDDGR